MRDVKTTTLQGYNAKYGQDKAAPLYVVNTSDGRLCFNNKDSQSTTTVIVKVSYAPVDLTAQTERDALISNPHFRRLLASGRLVIVDNEDFEEVLKEDDDMREEYMRINGVEESDLGSVSIDMDRDKAEESKESLVADNEDPCSNPALASIVKECEMLDNDSDNSKLNSLKNTLKSKMRRFSAEELKEFANVVPEQSLRDIALDRVNTLEENEESAGRSSGKKKKKK